MLSHASNKYALSALSAQKKLPDAVATCSYISAHQKSVDCAGNTMAVSSRQLFEKKMQLFCLKFRHGVENVLIFHFYCG